jgi:hypothetical protein
MGTAEEELFLLWWRSQPRKAASNSHSPNKCKILLHFGLPGARGLRLSFPNDVKEEALDADEGPELGADAVAIAELLLVVRPIRDDFGIPTKEPMVKMKKWSA